MWTKTFDQGWGVLSKRGVAAIRPSRDSEYVVRPIKRQNKIMIRQIRPIRVGGSWSNDARPPFVRVTRAKSKELGMSHKELNTLHSTEFFFLSSSIAKSHITLPVCPSTSSSLIILLREQVEFSAGGISTEVMINWIKFQPRSRTYTLHRRIQFRNRRSWSTFIPWHIQGPKCHKSGLRKSWEDRDMVLE